MRDSFLDLFKIISYNKEEKGNDTLHTLEIDIDRMVTKIIVPQDLLGSIAKADTDKVLGNLFMDRIMIGITEGVAEALHTFDPEVFPDFEEFRNAPEADEDAWVKATE